MGNGERLRVDFHHYVLSKQPNSYLNPRMVERGQGKGFRRLATGLLGQQAGEINFRPQSLPVKC